MPPFNIFLSEFLVMTAGFGTGQFLVTSVMIILLVVVFAGFLRHLVPMVFGNPASGKAVPTEKGTGTDGMGAFAVVPMLILAALVIVLGFYIPQPLQTLIRDATQVFAQGAASK
jgi:hydrogenase-4 component F